ncbi:MAG TPA: CAP domain-containing protein, partial [Burkholderiaceae bacterium]|nr:CAP domain-containing protein [Burkholderiaceae bacterium]
MAAAAVVQAFAQPAHAQVGQQREPSVVASKSRAAARAERRVEAINADTAEAARRIVALTNAFRRGESLPPTGPAPQLTSTARYFADFMARTGKFSHSADGTEPAARAKRFGYEYCTVAENIGYVFSTGGIDTAELARRIFEGWQNSPEHRKNMVNADVTETAVAIAR